MSSVAGGSEAQQNENRRVADDNVREEQEGLVNNNMVDRANQTDSVSLPGALAALFEPSEHSSTTVLSAMEPVLRPGLWCALMRRTLLLLRIQLRPRHQFHFTQSSPLLTWV